MERNWNVKIEFVPQDFWIGVFWRTKDLGRLTYNIWREIYICLLPCFPIVIRIPVGEYGKRPDTEPFLK